MTEHGWHSGEQGGTYVVQKVSVHDDHKVPRDKVEPVDVRRPMQRQAVRSKETRSEHQHIPEAKFASAQVQDLQECAMCVEHRWRGWGRGRGSS